MSYTRELIDEVKELYPDSKEMHKHAESGSVWLGRYLDDSVPYGLTTKEILEANYLEDLKIKARIIEKKRNLYNMWREQSPRITQQEEK